MRVRDNNLLFEKLNRKGMTLIEVIVAMAILAIIVTPTLRMFATSSGMNLRSKYTQRATTVGESVMESFKAYTIEQLCHQFRTTGAGGFKGTNGTTNVGAILPGVMGEGSPLLSDDTLNMDATGIHFTITGATYETSVYNIDIWAKPVKNPTIMSFDGPNVYSDAIIEVKENIVQEEGTSLTLAGLFTELRNKAKTDFLASHTTGYSINDVVLSDMKREININITDNGVSQTVTKGFKYTCKAAVKYTYSSGGAAPVSGTYNVPDTTMVYEVQYDNGAGGTTNAYKVYDNTATIAGPDALGKNHKLNNVYLYYYPALADVYGTGCEDSINITGSLSNLYNGDDTDASRAAGTEPLKVYIARQAPLSMTDTQLSTSDMAYSYQVTESLGGTGKCYLYHNYGEVLREGLTYPTPSISGHVTGFDDIKLITEGIVRKTNLIYELQVEVYDADTGKELAKFTGTKNE